MSSPVPPFFRAFATVGGLTLVSRVLGFVRDMVTAAMLGAGPWADAFFIALKFPNFFRRLTAEGALTVAFVPLFARVNEEEGKDAAREFADRVWSLMVWVLLPLSVFAIIYMENVVPLFAPGLKEFPERFAPAVMLSRYTFGYLLLMSLTALVGGMLNALGRYAPFALAPTFFNICLLAALYLAAPYAATDPSAIPMAMAVAVTISGAVQGVWVHSFLSIHGWGIRMRWPSLSPMIKRLFRNMGPGILGAGVVQVNVLVDTILATYLPVGAVSYLFYADRLQQLPLGIIGVGAGTALLPMLSRALAAKDDHQCRSLLSQAISISWILALPAGIGLCVFAHPLVEAIYGRGKFLPTDVWATAWALQAYAVGIPAYIVAKILGTCFYAREDTATPVWTSGLCAVMNVVFSLILMNLMKRFGLGHAGLAIATTISGWVNAGLLLVLLKRRVKREHQDGIGFDTHIFDRSTVKTLVGVGFAGLVMAVLVGVWGYFAIPYLKSIFASGSIGFGNERIGLYLGVLGGVGIGGLVYFGCLFGLGIFTPSRLIAMLKPKAKPVTEITETV